VTQRLPLPKNLSTGHVVSFLVAKTSVRIFAFVA
jgi:hypothetical protein